MADPISLADIGAKPSEKPAQTSDKSGRLTQAQAARWVTAYVLGASVFVLAWAGKLPITAYMDMIAVPGLAFLGVHTAAKSLN